MRVQWFPRALSWVFVRDSDSIRSRCQSDHVMRLVTVGTVFEVRLFFFKKTSIERISISLSAHFKPVVRNGWIRQVEVLDCTRDQHVV